jgi:excisionase family DNA binding protein
MPASPYLTSGVAAQRLGLTNSAIRWAIHSGHLAAFRTCAGGAWWRLNPGDVDRLAEAGDYRYPKSPPGTLLDIRTAP